MTGEVVRFGSGIAFIFCSYACADTWTKGQHVEPVRIHEHAIVWPWCVSCSECGVTFYRPDIPCDQHAPEPCDPIRWELTRTAAQFALRWRKMSAGVMCAVGKYVHIPADVWRAGEDLAVFMRDVDGGELAAMVWTQRAHPPQPPF